MSRPKKPTFSLDALATAPKIPLPPKRKPRAPKPPRFPKGGGKGRNDLQDLDARALAVATRQRATKLMQIRLPVAQYRTLVELCESRDETLANLLRYTIAVGMRAIADGVDAPRDDAPFGLAPENGYARPMSTFRDLQENRRWNEHGFSSVAAEGYREMVAREQAQAEAIPVRAVASSMAASLRGMLPASAPPPSVVRYAPPPQAVSVPSPAEATPQEQSLPLEVPPDAEPA